MNKKIIVALATSLLLTNGAAAAFADNGSDSDKSTTSVSFEGKWDDFKLTAAQKAEFKADRDAYKAKRKAIMAAFHTAMENAREQFKAAKEAATTDEARKAAEVAFKAEVSIAVQVKTDALKALGSKPDKPALTAEQLAAIEKYRQDVLAFKAEFKIYLEKREAIRLAYKEALKALGEGPVRPEAPDFSN
ncbi:MAG: Spy/CpxP family protein refolding chaperone [Ilumatobacteraceae bacterium]